MSFFFCISSSLSRSLSHAHTHTQINSHANSQEADKTELFSDIGRKIGNLKVHILTRTHTHTHTHLHTQDARTQTKTGNHRSTDGPTVHHKVPPEFCDVICSQAHARPH